MKILAIETATDACSAALLIDNEVAVEYELAPRKHTQLILPMIERLMAKAQLKTTELDAIAFGQGPGAFTGLRIAAGVTQGIALSADLPVIPISTLAAMAQQSHQQYNANNILVALDARINEVYWGKYVIVEGRASLSGNEQVILPEKIEPILNESWIGVGSGWEAYRDELQSKATEHLKQIYPELTPSAEFIAQLASYEFQQGNVLPVEQAQPIYLRDKVADTIAERMKKSN
ncbi:MAG: tRNA (adenosine(37)-N6)-threonylcarbamoyltransferase complex dimerization subunit type 1 TsaB [Thiotrichaceae bacterium]